MFSGRVHSSNSLFCRIQKQNSQTIPSSFQHQQAHRKTSCLYVVGSQFQLNRLQITIMFQLRPANNWKQIAKSPKHKWMYRSVDCVGVEGGRLLGKTAVLLIQRACTHQLGQFGSHRCPLVTTHSPTVPKMCSSTRSNARSFKCINNSEIFAVHCINWNPMKSKHSHNGMARVVNW